MFLKYTRFQSDFYFLLYFPSLFQSYGLSYTNTSLPTLLGTQKLRGDQMTLNLIDLCAQSTEATRLFTLCVFEPVAIIH